VAKCRAAILQKPVMDDFHQTAINIVWNNATKPATSTTITALDKQFLGASRHLVRLPCMAIGKMQALVITNLLTERKHGMPVRRVLKTGFNLRIRGEYLSPAPAD